MKLTQTLLTAAAISCFAYSASAQSVTFDFKNNTVTGGTLVLTETGTGALDDFTGDRFDELTSAGFQITGIGGGIGTLTGTATTLIDDLNVTGSGLQDGSNGYDALGEGTIFAFSKNIIVTGLDFGGFTSIGSDSVTISSGATTIGTFEDGETIGSTSFANTNAVTASIAVTAEDAFKIENVSGTYYLESITFTVVPEPGTYALLAGFCALGFVMLRRRSA